MIRVAISVEGYTEDEFCKRVLFPYFIKKGITITPIIVTTKRNKCGTNYKGGCINLDRVKSEITRLLPNYDYVTTFYDLYGFKINENLTADEIEIRISDLFNNRKLIPYIQKYEFETLLFSEPSYYSNYFEDKKAKGTFEKIINSCGGVEEINNSKETAPSKRIQNIFNQYSDRYDKVFHGYSIAEDIGLDIILLKCTRFKHWVEKIQNLS
jgi:hypothetical protein